MSGIIGKKECNCGCSSNAPKGIFGEEVKVVKKDLNTGFVKPAMTHTKRVVESEEGAQLMQWPVQLKIAKSDAAYFEGADLLIAADCTAYAYADFHRDFIRGKITLIGCPKLDDTIFYRNKLIEIMTKNDIKSVTVVRMSVPCCEGIAELVQDVLKNIDKEIPYDEVKINPEGEKCN